MTGRKDDAGKPRWGLLPKGTMTLVVEVLTLGAVKYAPDNWMRVPDPRTRYYEALMRHTVAWWEGEPYDVGADGDGKHHLAHAICCALFLLWFDLNQKEV